MTIDSLQYTFNGFGEYIFVDADNGTFELQIRTAPVGDGVATAVVAIAAKDSTSPRLGIYLTPMGPQVFTDTALVDLDLEDELVFPGGLTLVFDEEGLNATFAASNVNVRVTGYTCQRVYSPF